MTTEQGAAHCGAIYSRFREWVGPKYLQIPRRMIGGRPIYAFKDPDAFLAQERRVGRPRNPQLEGKKWTEQRREAARQALALRNSAREAEGRREAQGT